MTNMAVEHPFHPRTLEIPNYAPNNLTRNEILVAYFGCVSVFIIPVLVISKWCAKRPLSVGQQLIICWFSLCGFTHVILEGYFCLNHKSVPGSQNVLAQIWKEYSKGDSRYVISDPTVLSIESITAFVEGPFCFVTVYAYIRQSPWRYIIQLLISIGQLYGTVVFFAVEYLDGFQHGIMWHPVYFWFYFIFMNLIWLIVPSIMSIHSMFNLNYAQKLCDRPAMKTSSKSKLKKK